MLRRYDRGPVLFDEATHTYRVRLGGAEWPIAVSATGLIGRHFAAFDGPAVAARGVARWKAHPVYGPIIRAHPDDPAAAIVAHWDAAGRAAAAFGTMVHAWAERWLIGIAAPPPPDAAVEAAQVRRFVAAQRAAGFEVAAAELRVFWRSAGPGDGVRIALGPPVLAGMCDALFVGPDGAHTLVDWKCSAKPLDGARAPWTKKGVGCLAHLDDTKLVRYSLQVAPPPCLPQPRPTAIGTADRVAARAGVAVHADARAEQGHPRDNPPHRAAAHRARPGGGRGPGAGERSSGAFGDSRLIYWLWA